MEKLELTLRSPTDTVKVQTYLINIMQDLQNGKQYDCEIGMHREKRSKNANDYSWVLQNKIAKAVNRRIDDIHKEMVLQYGVLETYSILKEASESAMRMFDYYEILGESEVKGKTFVHVKAGLGTHTYNTAEMSRFIDGVVQEAKDLDIETKTPAEIAELKSLWESER